VRTGAEVRVGLITLLAIALLAFFAYHIKGRLGAARTYTIYVTFDDARGLQRGDPVHLVGVRIGEVRAVEVTPPPRKAQVLLAIQKQHPLYRNYLFQIVSAGLIQERAIEVIPAPPGKEGLLLEDQTKVHGVTAPDLAQLLKAGQEVLISLNRTSEQLRSVLSSQQVLSGIERALDSFARAADSAAKMAATATEIAQEAEPKTEAALTQLRQAAEDVQATTGAIRSRVERGTTLEDFEVSARHLRETSQHMADLTGSLDELVSDPQVKTEVRELLSALRDTSLSLRKISSDLEVFSGELRKAAPSVPKVAQEAEGISTKLAQFQERLKPPEMHADFRVLYSSHAGRSFSTGNIDFSYPATPDRFLRLGVDDIGEESSANVQLGEQHRLGILRYGLVRSRLGLGLDFSLPRRSALSLDLFNPNALRADIFAEVPVGRTDWSLLTGARDLGEENLFIVGARLKR